jgi:hypothetical protein
MSSIGRLVFSSSRDDQQDPDYVYYNGTIISNRTGLNNNGVELPNPECRFLETRDVPIIRDASKYNFSIIRFTINGANRDLPLFIPPIRIGKFQPITPNINLTIYSVTLDLTVSYVVGGITYTNTFTTVQPLYHTTETPSAPVPSITTVTTGSQDLGSRYYWYYTYQHWLDVLNTAFEAAYSYNGGLIVDQLGNTIQTDGFQAQLATWWTATVPGALPVPTLNTAPPVMKWDATTFLFTLFTDVFGFGGPDRVSATPQPLLPQPPYAPGDTVSESYRIWFNNNLFGMFANFNNIYDNLATNKSNEIIIRSDMNDNVYRELNLASPPALIRTYWTTTQDFASTGTLWSPIESIVFTSNLLPLVNEAQGEPIKFGESNIGENNGATQSAFQPIITDIALAQDYAHSYKEFINYTPQAEYRLASFQRSSTPINAIDVQVFWKSRLDGQIYPVQLFNGSSVGIKCMFRRRGVFDYPHPAKVGIDV